MKLLNSELFLVLSRPPEWFPIRRDGAIGTCAMHALKAIVEGYDPATTQQVSAYAKDIFSKISGFMLPFSVTRVLRNYKVPYEVFYGKGSYTQKLALLKEKLQRWPVFLLIANAYAKGGTPNFLNAISHWHYITVWGYDDQKQLLYIYDSNTQKRNFSNLPIGNSWLSYKELIYYWSIGATWIVRCYGISVWYR